MNRTCQSGATRAPSAGDICLQLDGVPPSVNNAYTNNRFGGRTLSEEGRSYKQMTSAQVAQRYPMLMRRIQKDKPYLVVIRFFLPVNCKGWPKKADSRYKKFDADNRLKLLLDALKEACGIDDSQFLKVYVEKNDSIEERTEVWLWNLEEEVRPIAELIQQAAGQ